MTHLTGTRPRREITRIHISHISLHAPAMTSRFNVRKQHILQQLDVPDDEYQDLSPKGSVDGPIRELIGEINALGGLVTTSSCSGRISVFLEGRKAGGDDVLGEETGETRAGPGGKGGGGAWLFISHSPIDDSQVTSTETYMSLCGMEDAAPEDARGLGVQSRYIHLKFEPMVSSISTVIHRI
jgi:tRNA wybutosine-synthesizing protein 3